MPCRRLIDAAISELITGPYAIGAGIVDHSDQKCGTLPAHKVQVAIVGQVLAVYEEVDTIGALERHPGIKPPPTIVLRQFIRRCEINSALERIVCRCRDGKSVIHKLIVVGADATRPARRVIEAISGPIGEPGRA